MEESAIKKIIGAIENDDISTALEIISENDNNNTITISMLKSQYRKLEKDIINGMLSSEQQNVNAAKIKNNILSFLDIIKKNNSESLVKNEESIKSLIIKQTEYLSNHLNAIKSDTSIIKAKLLDFIDSFNQFKQNNNLTLEEKILKLETLIDKVHIRNVNDYEQKMRIKISRFDLLETDTQNYLSIGLYFLEEAMPTNHSDYSAAALQFCRAVELELKNKIFKAFKQHTLSTSYLDEHIMLSTDKEKKTFKNLLGFIQSAPSFITLNQMSYIIEITPIPHVTQLWQDFDNYIIPKFADLGILKQNLNALRSADYRNKSAHTAPVNKLDAENCMRLCINIINSFI